MSIAPVQSATPGTATATPSSPTISRTLPVPPTVGNLMVAVVNGAYGPFTGPTGWTLASPGGANLTTNIWCRQAQTGDTAGPYVFSEANIVGSDNLEMTLMEFGGFDPGTVSVDLHAVMDNSPATTISVSPGTTQVANELVVGAVGVGGGASSPVWSTQGMSADSGFLTSSLATAHVALTATQSLNPITVSWSGTAHSSTLTVATFAVIPQIPVVTQKKTGFSASGTSQAVTLDTAPTPGNLVVAKCCTPNDLWTAPAGWSQASLPGGNLVLAFFYRRVQAGDPAGYTFTHAGPAAQMAVELKEWTGLPGTAVAELVAVMDKAPAHTSAINPGATSEAIGIVEAAIAVGASGTASWNLGLSVDSDQLGGIMSTAHLVTAAPTDLTGLAATWVNDHSSTLGVVAFAFVPYQVAIAAVYRGYTGFGPQPVGAETSVASAAGGANTNTNTVTPDTVNALLVAFAATVNMISGAEATTIVGGTQRAAVATTGPGLNPAAAVADMPLDSPAATTWTFAGSRGYAGQGRLISLIPAQPDPGP